MKILLTGSSGLVGRNVFESPRSQNYELLTPSHKELDLLDKDAVFDYLEKNYPVAEWINHYGFYVGCHHGLQRDQLDKIINCIHGFLKERLLE